MCKSFAIIGGDRRMVILADLLARENKVITYGLELAEHEKEIIKAPNLKTATEEAETIIGPIPFSKDGDNVFTEYSKSKRKKVNSRSGIKRSL